MSDQRQSFPILEDSAASGGSAPTRTQIGDAMAAKVYVPVVAFQDTNGNAAVVQLTADNKVPVSTEPIGTRLRNRGIATSAATGSMTTVATIALTATKNYLDHRFLVACRRDCLAQLVFNNNGVKTILDEVILGPGQYSFEMDGDGEQFTASGSVSQSLDLQAQTLQVPSDVHATVWVTQQA